MTMFEYVLMFIRATGQGSWMLHLNSLHQLAKYIFALELQNYARLIPVYLSQMFEIKNQD